MWSSCLPFVSWRCSSLHATTICTQSMSSRADWGVFCDRQQPTSYIADQQAAVNTTHACVRVCVTLRMHHQGSSPIWVEKVLCHVKVCCAAAASVGVLCLALLQCNGGSALVSGLGRAVAVKDKMLCLVSQPSIPSSPMPSRYIIIVWRQAL